MSRILCGNENMHVELRVWIFFEPCLNKFRYLNDDYLKELREFDGCIEELFDNSFDISADVKGKDEMQRYNEALKAGVIDTIKPFKYSNIWHIFALCNLNGCSITSVYPCVHGSLMDRNYVNISIQPAKKRCSSQVVLWTHTSSWCGHTPRRQILRVRLQTIL